MKAKYFANGGVYDAAMSTLSPAPNNYAVIMVARPHELAEYDRNYQHRDVKPVDSKTLFRSKMSELFPVCCCSCSLQNWSIIWLIWMILQNSLWFASSVLTTVILYDPYGDWVDCTDYSQSDDFVDCRDMFETNGLTKEFSVTAAVVAGIAVMINIWCWWAIYHCDAKALMAQIWWLYIEALFMMFFSCFTGYVYSLFAILVPLLLSCHFYDVYVLLIYCQQRINTRRIPRMQAVVVEGQPSPSTGAPKVVYVSAPEGNPIQYVSEKGVVVQQPVD